MLKNKIQKTYLKIKDQWWFLILAFFIAYIITAILDKIKISDINVVYLFGVRIVSAPLHKVGLLILELFKIQISIFSILIGLLLSLLLIRVYKKNIIFKRRKLIITDAWYGKDNQKINITRELNNAISENKLKLVLSNNIAGDPAFGVGEEACIKYIYNQKELKREYKENEVNELP